MDIVDGELVSVRDRSLAACSSNGRYSANAQIAVDAAPALCSPWAPWCQQRLHCLP